MVTKQDAEAVLEELGEQFAGGVFTVSTEQVWVIVRARFAFPPPADRMMACIMSILDAPTDQEAFDAREFVSLYSQADRRDYSERVGAFIDRWPSGSRRPDNESAIAYFCTFAYLYGRLEDSMPNTALK